MEKIKWTIVFLMVAVMCSTGCRRIAKESETEGADINQLYKEILYKELEQEYSIARFELYDLDANGIPELFVSDGDYHSGGATMYAVVDNNVVNVARFGEWGITYVAEGGYINSHYFGMGVGSGTYYKWENNELIKLISWVMGTNLDGTEIMQINDEDVTYEEYDKAMDEFDELDGLEWIEVGRKLAIDAEAIEAAFGQ